MGHNKAFEPNLKPNKIPKMPKKIQKPLKVDQKLKTKKRYDSTSKTKVHCLH